MTAATCAADAPADADADLQDLIRESVITIDGDGRITGWNAASTTLYGWTRDEATGRDLESLLGSRFPTRAAGEVHRLTRTGARRTVSVRRQWIAPDRLIETGWDVTAERQRIRALNESEARHQLLLEAMSASFWELDFSSVGDLLRKGRDAGVTDWPAYFAEHPDFVREMMRETRVITVNDRSVAMFGCGGDRDALPDSVEPYWPPESTADYAGLVFAMLSRRNTASVQTVLRRVDGSKLPVLFATCNPDEAIRSGNVRIAILDLTDRIEAERALQDSERRYAIMFKALPMALAQNDSRALRMRLAGLRANGVTDIAAEIHAHPGLLEELMDSTFIVEMNDMARAMVGPGGADQILGRSVRHFWGERPDTFLRMLEARFAGATSFSEETRLTMPGGRVSDVIYSVAFPPEFNALGMSIITLIDTSDRLAAERALEETRAQLAHASKVMLLGEFAATMAHEVNQPLAAVSTTASAAQRWLQRDPPDIDRIRTLMDRIAADASRAAAVVASVRAAAASNPPPPELVDLPELIEQVTGFLRREISIAGAVVTIDTSDCAGAVAGDRTQLQQLIANLVINSVQAVTERQEGARHIHILCKTQGDSAIVSIADTGLGFPPGSGPALFGSFFTTKPEGMGMGLAIVRSIAERHGGSIAASSDGATGATFTVTLPRAPADERRAPSLATTA